MGPVDVAYVCKPSGHVGSWILQSTDAVNVAVAFDGSENVLNAARDASLAASK